MKGSAFCKFGILTEKRQIMFRSASIEQVKELKKLLKIFVTVIDSITNVKCVSVNSLIKSSLSNEDVSNCH